MEHFQPRGVELSLADRVEISALSVIQNSHALLHDKIFNPGQSSTPGLKF